MICLFPGVSNLHRGKICKFIPESNACLLPSHFAKRHYHDCGWGIGYVGHLLRDVILIMVRGRGYIGRLQNLNKAKVKVLILVSKLTLSSASLQSLYFGIRVYCSNSETALSTKVAAK